MDTRTAIKVTAATVGIAVLWVSSRKLSGYRCERFYLLVPVVWLLLEILFRRNHVPSLTGAHIFGFVIIASLVMVLFQSTASMIGGRILWRETLLTGYFCLSLWLIVRYAYAGSKSVVFGAFGWPRSGIALGFAWGIMGLLLIGLFFPYIFAVLQIHRPRIASRANPRTELSLEYEAINFTTSDGLKIHGWFIPNSGSNTTVIMSHGLGANAGNFLPAVPFFHSAGYNVLIFEFRGHGESNGHTISFGYFERFDVKAAVDFLHNEKPDCASSVIAYGPSMAGAAMINAASEGSAIDLVIVDCTFADMNEMIEAQFQMLPRLLRGWMRWVTTGFGILELGVATDKLSPRNVVANISPRPILIIHGTADRLIPCSQSEKLFAAASEPKELWLVKDADHYGSMWQDAAGYEERVFGFIEKHLSLDKQSKTTDSCK